MLGFLRVKTTSASSARDFLARERNFFLWIRLSTLLAVLSASLILQLKLPDSISPDQPRKRRRDELPQVWDKLPLSSEIFACIFLGLSLLALITGLVDYLDAERKLELETVDFDETEGTFNNDGHTKHFVHVVMGIIGIGIIASAVWLIAS